MSIKTITVTASIFLTTLVGFSVASHAQSKLDALRGVAKKDFNAAATIKTIPDPPAPHLRYDPPEIAPNMGTTSTQVGTHSPFTPSLSDTFNDAASRF